MKTIALVLCALSFAACGGTSTDDTANFVGTWQPNTGGAFTFVCPSGNAISAVDTPTTFAKGTLSDLAVTDQGCSFLFDVNGTAASARAGQHCTISDSTSTAALEVSAWTFDTTDGIKGSETANGSATITRISDGAVGTCTFTEAATYQRVSH